MEEERRKEERRKKRRRKGTGEGRKGGRENM